MGYKILRFLGALISVNVFIYLVQLFHLFCMVGVLKLFEDFSWRNLLGLDLVRGLLIPVAWFIFYWISVGIAWIVRGSKIIAALPLISFVIMAIGLFINLFVSPSNAIADEVNSWGYYTVSVVTYLIIIGWFAFCSILMFVYEDE